MRPRSTIIVLALAALAASGCGGDQDAVKTSAAKQRESRQVQAAERISQGQQLMAYAPPTDYLGAAPEDAAGNASRMFDGTKMRDAVSSGGYVPAGAAGPGRGKTVRFTAPAPSKRPGLDAVEPPLPDTYDYSASGATPGTAKGAGQTLLGFAKFQLDQKFATVAPIMSRLGWHAAAREGSNEAQTPFRVTVHHTDGHTPMNEAQAAAEAKGIQWYHMVGRGKEGKDNFADIGYHFLIAGDGRVIEGRHAEYLGAHVKDGNDGNIGIAMMGDFNKQKPTPAQVESLTRLVTFLAVKYKKEPANKGFLEGHQHYNNTDCPGKNMMAILGALRAKIDKEAGMIMAGGVVGANDAFAPLAVQDAPSA